MPMGGRHAFFPVSILDSSGTGDPLVVHRRLFRREGRRRETLGRGGQRNGMGLESGGRWYHHHTQLQRRSRKEEGWVVYHLTHRIGRVARMRCMRRSVVLGRRVEVTTFLFLVFSNFHRGTWQKTFPDRRRATNGRRRSERGARRTIRIGHSQCGR